MVLQPVDVERLLGVLLFEPALVEAVVCFYFYK